MTDGEYTPDTASVEAGYTTNEHIGGTNTQRREAFRRWLRQRDVAIAESVETQVSARFISAVHEAAERKSHR